MINLLKRLGSLFLRPVSLGQDKGGNAVHVHLMAHERTMVAAKGTLFLGISEARRARLSMTARLKYVFGVTKQSVVGKNTSMLFVIIIMNWPQSSKD